MLKGRVDRELKGANSLVNIRQDKVIYLHLQEEQLLLDEH